MTKSMTATMEKPAPATIEPVGGTRAESRTKVRPEIQGLRAVAVTLVIAYHFFPTTLTGGFVGVDVFFVISGYLITALLLRELHSTGTISLTKFYGRRIRRLMPAAITVTIATTVTAALLVGPIQLVKILQDAAWVTLYAANIRFGLDPAGYFATSDPSPFLHFWSLAVEEQFYLVWPVLILVAAWLWKSHPKRAIGIMLGIVIVGSLTASVLLTNAESVWGYYSLGTRAWELGIGAALAWILTTVTWSPPRSLTAVASFAGVGAIILAAVTFTEATPFPGYTAALPTIGTALIIWGSTYHDNIISRALSIRPAVYLGNISYSLYLWHWPALILGIMLVGESREARALLVVVAVLLAAASYEYIEQNGKHVFPRMGGRRFIASAIALGMVVAIVPAVGATMIPTSGGPAVAAPEQEPAETATTDKTIVVNTTGPTPPMGVPSNVAPALIDLPEDLAEVFTNGCYSGALNVCEGGDPNGTVRIVLTGDSHAGQWWPALDAAATANGWKLFIVGKNGCPLADVPISKGATSDPWPDCTAWQTEATETIANLDADLIIYANHAQGYAAKQSLKDNFPEAWVAGVTTTLSRFAGTEVLYFGQSPVIPLDPGACLSDHIFDVAACEHPVSAVVRADISDLSRSLAEATGATFFDPLQLLCSEVCPMMDGNLVMYRDSSHLTRTYAAALSGHMGEVVRAALAS